MKFTYYGHSCFCVEVAGKKLVFDPFVTKNDLAKDKIKLEDIEADYILVSHGHFDHIADLEDLAKQTGAKVVSIWEIHQWIQDKGVENSHPMNIGGAWSFDFGRVKMVDAIHSSSFPDGTYAGAPAGFIVETKEGSFYYAGDTALMRAMRRWGRDYEFDFVVLPIGDNLTMGVDDALRASKALQCKRIIGCHFDTFPFIEIDHERAQGVFSDHGRDLILMEIGESMDL